MKALSIICERGLFGSDSEKKEYPQLIGETVFLYTFELGFDLDSNKPKINQLKKTRKFGAMKKTKLWVFFVEFLQTQLQRPQEDSMIQYFTIILEKTFMKIKELKIMDEEMYQTWYKFSKDLKVLESGLKLFPSSYELLCLQIDSAKDKELAFTDAISKCDGVMVKYLEFLITNTPEKVDLFIKSSLAKSNIDNLLDIYLHHVVHKPYSEFKALIKVIRKRLNSKRVHLLILECFVEKLQKDFQEKECGWFYLLLKEFKALEMVDSSIWRAFICLLVAQDDYILIGKVFIEWGTKDEEDLEWYREMVNQ
jgi:hypothetical protein